MIQRSRTLTLRVDHKTYKTLGKLSAHFGFETKAEVMRKATRLLHTIVKATEDGKLYFRDEKSKKEILVLIN